MSSVVIKSFKLRDNISTRLKNFRLGLGIKTQLSGVTIKKLSAYFICDQSNAHAQPFNWLRSLAVLGFSLAGLLRVQSVKVLVRLRNLSSHASIFLVCIYVKLAHFLTQSIPVTPPPIHTHFFFQIATQFNLIFCKKNKVYTYLNILENKTWPTVIFYQF